MEKKQHLIDIKDKFMLGEGATIFIHLRIIPILFPL
jgi:hypothetical protein